MFIKSNWGNIGNIVFQSLGPEIEDIFIYIYIYIYFYASGLNSSLVGDDNAHSKYYHYMRFGETKGIK